MPVEKRYEAITAIVNSAESLFSQENVHISEIKSKLEENEVYGQEMEDGSINEPNVDIRFEQPLTDFEIKALEKKNKRKPDLQVLQ